MCNYGNKYTENHMLNKIIITSVLLASSMSVVALTIAEQKQVDHLISLFKQNNVPAISQSIRYPLTREAPIPTVENAQEMQKRFNQIFDAELRQKIVHSSPQQWDSVGWRGMMFDGGKIWFDGEKITAVNYSSKAEQQLKQQLISNQKQHLHSSLRSFKEPKFSFTTKSFQVRIDQLNNGQYRYASWKINQPQSTKPDLILNQGSVKFDGSGGNHYYIFNSGSYRYTIERNVIGANDTAPVRLIVTQSKKVILDQSGKILDNVR